MSKLEKLDVKLFERAMRISRPPDMHSIGRELSEACYAIVRHILGKPRHPFVDGHEIMTTAMWVGIGVGIKYERLRAAKKRRKS